MRTLGRDRGVWIVLVGVVWVVTGTIASALIDSGLTYQAPIGADRTSDVLRNFLEENSDEGRAEVWLVALPIAVATIVLWQVWRARTHRTMLGSVVLVIGAVGLLLMSIVMALSTVVTLIPGALAICLGAYLSLRERNPRAR